MIDICLYGHCYVQAIREAFNWEKIIPLTNYHLHCYYIKSEYSFLHKEFREQLDQLCSQFPYVLNFSSFPAVNKYDKQYLDKGEWLPSIYPDLLKKNKEEIRFVEQRYYEETRSYLERYSGLTLCHILRYMREKHRGNYYYSELVNYKTLYETFASRSIDCENLDKQLNFSTMVRSDGIHIIRGGEKREVTDVEKLLQLIHHYYLSHIL